MDGRRRVRKQDSQPIQSVVDDDELGGTGADEIQGSDDDESTGKMGGKKRAKGKEDHAVSREPKKVGKGKKGGTTDEDEDEDEDEGEDEEEDPSEIVEEERTSSPEATTEDAHGAENSPAPTPSPILDDQPYRDSSSPASGYNSPTPSATDNEIVSCEQQVPEIDTKVDVSYVYNIVISDSVDIDSIVKFVEIQTLDAVASELVVCEGDRRRLSTLVAVSPLPKDVPSGSCGTGCTSVTGGLTLYVKNDGNTDAVYLRCQVVTVVRQTMLQIESSSYNGVSEIEFVDTDDIDCQDTATDQSGGGSLQGIHGIESQTSSLGEHEVSNGGLVGIALGSTLIAVLAFVVVRRYRHRDDGMAYVSTVDDKDDDLCSVVTPDTACDSRQSPHKTSPEREGTFASLPSTPEREVITDADGSPIAQFDPALLDASNRNSTSVVATSESIGFSKLFGVGAPFFARLRNPPSSESEDFTHDGVDDEFAAVLGDESTVGKAVKEKRSAKRVSPMLAIWQNSSSNELDGSGGGGSKFLTAIPEGEDEGDDHSVATAEISNVSPANKSPVRPEAENADCDVTSQGVYV
ncbi:hypothetical protein MHU86_10022 [Fragilaria crotonensis]|nr:hypothetical protein MHU86_10022 [Fragilaria crotonensis]